MALSDVEKKLIGKLLSTVAENKHSINLLASAAENYTTVTYPLLTRCQGCTRVATVKNDVLDLTLCDRCAAQAIVKATKAMTGESDNLDELREAAAREELWRDLAGGDAIRMIEEHYLLLHGDVGAWEQ